MSKFQMYKITIKNWSKHQGSLKKGHSHFLFSKRFFDDSKITMLSAGTILTYIWLLTVCSDCGGGELRDTFECHGGQMPHTLRTGGGRLEERLEQLQSFQLLTYEKINPLYNRIEKNRKEKKRITYVQTEKNPENIEPEKPEPEKPEPEKLALQPVDENSSTKNKTQILIALYCTLFKNKYQCSPIISKKDSGIAKRISENLSEEKAKLYLENYFLLPDTWLIKTKHPLASFETKLNEVAVFAQTGNFTTQKQSQELDKSISSLSTLQKIRDGKL